ncbi:NUDIX domain-containing protein [Epibacterium ulvae]|uniref:NUDIX domain-containing protein n=1 Tax=Epibacterium ulvae TaxID=1156985 RepID=UPI00203DA422|nr:NUDIX domain-containing protein [Epibacterium ulvae]
MTKFIDPIRPTARAVIRRDNSLLVQLKERPARGQYLTLPGGKQELGETLEDCVRRECAEEIGAEVAVHGLLHVAEVQKVKRDGLRHQIEFLFECSLPEGYVPQVGPHPDPSQTATIWADLTSDAHLFKPSYVRVLTDTAAPTYVGVLNG